MAEREPELVYPGRYRRRVTGAEVEVLDVVPNPERAELLVIYTPVASRSPRALRVLAFQEWYARVPDPEGAAPPPVLTEYTEDDARRVEALKDAKAERELTPAEGAELEGLTVRWQRWHLRAGLAAARREGAAP